MKYKSFITKLVGLTIFVILFSAKSDAQTPTFNLYITNEVQVSTTEYQFDIYLLRTGGTTFELANFQAGITVNPLVINGGTLTASVISGSTTLLNTAQEPAPIKVSYSVVNNLFNISAGTPPGSGAGSIISNVDGGCTSPGTRIARFKITNTVAFASGSTMNHTYNFLLGAGKVATKVFGYVGGLNTDITASGTLYAYNTAGTCTQNIVLGNCITYYQDFDSDGYGNTAVSIVSCTPPMGYVLNNTDCNDSNAAINPDETEICNFIDDDCDGTSDDGITYLIYYNDADGDGYGAGAAGSYCTDPGAGFSLTDDDCDDLAFGINPGATEICNAIDDDCTGGIDSGLTFLDYYVDADVDSYGDASASPVNSCSAVAGSVTNNGDCNDGNSAINPGATEICNFIDDDCDGTSDDGITYLVYYTDADLDGYGSGLGANYCSDPGAGFSLSDNDCDDLDFDVNPAATEICNTIDDDCDGTPDDGLLFTTYYADTDTDTYGDAFNTTSTCDVMPSGYVTDNTDCDDSQSTVYPGGTEICDGLDNDCDGDYDEGTVIATVTPAGAVTVCKNPGINLSSNTGIGYTYQWFKNGSPISGATSPIYHANKPGNYQVQVNIPEGCFALSVPTSISLNPSPNANIYAPYGTSLCAPIKLKVSYDATYTYQWKESGVPIVGEISWQYLPTTAGVYTCTITNAFGCSRTAIPVTVTACREEEIISTVFDISIELYPNPAENEFTLELVTNATDKFSSIQLFNIVGEEVYRQVAAVTNGKIQESILLDDAIPSGLYIVKIKLEEMEFTEQLVIQK